MEVSSVITACNLVQAEERTLFSPHLDNYYEQYLYERAERKTGISHFYTHRFKNSGFKGHLDAVETCFDQLIKDAGLYRKINKKKSSKVGVIYFDQYGPVSFFNADAQIKEMYYSDVFPSFILNSHNISGYSIRLRAERNALFQALQTAEMLIRDGILDMVIIGGVYQCIPYLFLSDLMDDYAWMKQRSFLKKGNTDRLDLADATGFLLLESAESAMNRNASILASVEDIQCHSYEAESHTSLANSAFSYPYLPIFRNTADTQENQARSDLGCMNIFRSLEQILRDRSQSNSKTINGLDRDNYAWSLKLNLHNQNN